MFHPALTPSSEGFPTESTLLLTLFRKVLVASSELLQKTQLPSSEVLQNESMLFSKILQMGPVLSSHIRSAPVPGPLVSFQQSVSGDEMNVSCAENQLHHLAGSGSGLPPGARVGYRD
jgi:hypothetical protein